MHVRETLLAAVKTRLDAIKGGAGYNYKDTFQGAERYIHTWSGDGHEVNTIRRLPKVVIKPISESASSRERVDTYLRRLELEMTWKMAGESSSCEDITKAVEDMEKALFSSFDGYTVNARNLEFEVRHIDLETRMPFDGVVFTLTVEYETLFQDPTQEP